MEIVEEEDVVEMVDEGGKMDEEEEEKGDPSRPEAGVGTKSLSI